MFRLIDPAASSAGSEPRVTAVTVGGFNVYAGRVIPTGGHLAPLQPGRSSGLVLCCWSLGESMGPRNSSEPPAASTKQQLADLRERLETVESERDALRQQIAQSQDRYNDFLAKTLAGYALHEIICDADGQPCDYRFIEVNPAFEQLTGLRAEQVVGQTVKQVLPAIEPYWIETYGQVALEGKTTRFENYSQALDRHYEVVAYCPKPRQFACVFIDVSARQHLEERLRRAQKMEAIGTLAGGIAHDFNNLLTGILGAASLLKVKLDRAGPLANQAELIERAGLRAAELAGQLLDFARKTPLQHRSVQIGQVLNETVSILRRTVDKRIDIVERYEEDTDYVLGDPGQLQQVAMNLGLNAVEAMPDGGELTLTTETLQLDDRGCDIHPELAPGRHVMFSITDTGVGIPRKIRNRIFDPFFTTKQLRKGTGMGLATSYGIVRSHGGALEVSSEPGQGTTFKVYLPVTSQGSAPSERPPLLATPVADATVLVVDDEETVGAVVHAMLSELGYHMVITTSGKEALATYQSQGDEIQLVLLDLTMPVMAGASCFRLLREQDPGVKVLLTSGHALNGEAQRLLDEGALGFIQKPFTMITLGQAVAAALSGTQNDE